MDAICYTADGQEVPMEVGDRLVDEFNATAIEYMGQGSWKSLLNVPVRGQDCWLTMGAHCSAEAARSFAEASWEEVFTSAQTAEGGTNF